MISLKNVSKKYKTGYALNLINIDFPSTGLFFIKGPSGAGKSTLLKVMSLETTINSGEIYFNGELISNASLKRKNQYRLNDISVIQQSNDFIQTLTIRENINLVLEAKGKCDNETLNEIFNQFDISNIVDKYPNEVSCGEAQRASIALAILKGSKIILGDEITSALDDNNKHIIIDLLKKISKDILIVISTHDEDILRVEDNIIEIKNGVITKKIELENVKSKKVE